MIETPVRERFILHKVMRENISFAARGFHWVLRTVDIPLPTAIMKGEKYGGKS